MHRRFSFMMGTIGAFSLILGGLNGDMYAQRGAAGGHAAVPTNVGQGRQPDVPTPLVNRTRARGNRIRPDSRPSPIS